MRNVTSSAPPINDDVADGSRCLHSEFSGGPTVGKPHLSLVQGEARERRRRNCLIPPSPSPLAITHTSPPGSGASATLPARLRRSAAEWNRSPIPACQQFHRFLGVWWRPGAGKQHQGIARRTPHGCGTRANKTSRGGDGREGEDGEQAVLGGGVRGGGVQDACDDACSICLDAFCDSNPSTMTNCKHDYHLQCILEWCQRSSQCPMCWQPISMKDPLSQELLEAVEQERNIRANRSHNTAVFHHPMLGDFEIPVGADDAELEERIIQHLAAAAAARRSHRHHRRDGHQSRSGASSHPQVLVLSADERTISGEEGDCEQAPAVVSGRPLRTLVEQERTRGLVDASGPSLRFSTPADSTGRSNNRISGIQSTPVDQDGAGPSDLQSISDNLRSRLQSASMRYKDSITKSASGWRERWFSRSNSLSDLGSEVRREVNAGIAAVSRMMERHDARDGTGASPTSASGSGSQ